MIRHIVPPFGDGIFPPYGINIIADLSNGYSIRGRTIHLCDLSPEGFHCVAFIADNGTEAIFFGAVPHQLGPPCKDSARVVVRSWREVTEWTDSGHF